MSEDFKDSIVMLPHCGNCGYLFRLDYEEINQFYEKVKSIRAAADIDADEMAEAIVELSVNGGLRWHE